MVRNGLFLISLSMLLFIFSINNSTIQYDILSIITSLTLFLLGISLCMKGKKKEASGSTKEK